MAKSARHKKLRKQEKAKIQLKAKKLKPAQNVVNPQVRSRKIIIQEQFQALAAQTECEVTHQRKNIQEIFRTLSHHNVNVRKEAVTGLCELIEFNNVFENNLKELLERSASLTSDIEGAVRKANLKLGEIIYDKLEEDQLRPFWDDVFALIKCSLTHMTPSIRYSTLKYLKKIMDRFHSLTYEHRGILLPCLMRLIGTYGRLEKSSGSYSMIRSSDQIDYFHKRLEVIQVIGQLLEVNHIVPKSQTSFPECNMDSLDNYRHLFCPIDSSCYDEDMTILQGLSSLKAEDIITCLKQLCSIWFELNPNIGFSGKKKKGKVLNSDSDMRAASSLTKSSVDALIHVTHTMYNLFRQINEIPSTSLVDDSLSLSKDCNGDDEKPKEYSTVDLIKSEVGEEITKYFFDPMPFSSTNQQGRLCLANVRLFWVCSSFGMLDKKMKIKFGKFLKALGSDTIVGSSNEETVLLLLEILKNHVDSSWRTTVTQFVVEALKQRDKTSETVLDFLSELSDPGNLSESAELFLKGFEPAALCQHILEYFMATKSLSSLKPLVNMAKRNHNTDDLRSSLISNQEKLLECLGNIEPSQDASFLLALFYYSQVLSSFAPLISQHQIFADHSSTITILLNKLT